MSAALVWCPFPDEDEAAALAGRLLDEGLIVCANLLPAMRSLYRWNGERGEARECGALFKTTPVLLPEAIARIEALHSYAAPAIVGWAADACGAATAAWLADLDRAAQ
ncbi:MAG: divalent-cation tolerance protein CutA [Novosphingobium sp.]|nr:divalent-cation tolerance protein CutA [Novosphingobium sp.]MBO9602361.1 divalent-cation tolerance protein CutA [Novosphingobium sp.]